MANQINVASDGIVRCLWPGMDEFYMEYHDTEWGVPVGDDDGLFERICLEGFQSGLSWITILRKRNNFRQAFKNFNIEEVAGLDEKDFQRLMNDEGIIRHKGKIKATINNAQRAIEIIDEKGSLASYLWSWETNEGTKESCPNRSLSTASEALSKDLKARGWSWVGPTTIYSFMQAVGMVNDHSKKCHSWEKIEDLRTKFIRP
ncbi:MAG: DNA-3-methyladenine glycosylase I [Actinobacteria bacterium]|nr:DNA-3-methyladenine glycosylase I [Actinomycetota bacterium]|tara:strand:+ start:2972 stop:3580 length:609 start_codon:yes stop_codon:yes gene_type:complete